MALTLCLFLLGLVQPSLSVDAEKALVPPFAGEWALSAVHANGKETAVWKELLLFTPTKLIYWKEKRCAGGRYTLVGRDEQVYKIDLDLNAPGEGEGSVLRKSLLVVNGDTLTLVHDPRPAVRPTSIDPGKEPHAIILTYKRVRSSRPTSEQVQSPKKTSNTALVGEWSRASSMPEPERRTSHNETLVFSETKFGRFHEGSLIGYGNYAPSSRNDETFDLDMPEGLHGRYSGAQNAVLKLDAETPIVAWGEPGKPRPTSFLSGKEVGVIIAKYKKVQWHE